MLTNFTCPQRPVRFHQYHPASFSEPWLATAALPVHQLQQLFTQYVIPKQVGQSHDRLLPCADALHHIGPLLQQLLKFFVCSPHYFLDVWITTAGKVLGSASVTGISRALHDRPPEPAARRRASYVRQAASPAHPTPGIWYVKACVRVPSTRSDLQGRRILRS